MDINFPLQRLGEYVYNTRKRLGMSQIDFYNHLFPEKILEHENIKKKMNAIENGKTKHLNCELLFRLHDKFDVSIDYLLGYKTDFPNYDNEAACNYTGLNSHTIQQMHFWNNYASRELPTRSDDMTDDELREHYITVQRCKEAKWILRATNMLFEHKSQEDTKAGISDLTVLYDLYMMCNDLPETINASTYDRRSGKIDIKTVLTGMEFSFTDKMGEPHSIDLREISRRIWKDRLLRDVDAITESLKGYDLHEEN